MTEKITGYRNLSAEDLALINEGKEMGAMIGEYIERLKGIGYVDQRWLAIGATDVQKGFMAITRAIARPDNF